MSSRKIAQDEIELLDVIKKYVDERWDQLNSWEKKFVEDIIARYDQYKANMFISTKQVDILLQISEKII